MNKQVLISSFKKEIWEFNKTLYWVPLIIAILMVVAPGAQLLLLEDFRIDRILAGLNELQHQKNIEGLENAAMMAMAAISLPFMLIALIVQLYYFTASMYDERRDQSIYFWRSLPVSDATTVGVKLAMGALVIPGIFGLGATLAMLVYLVFFFIGTVVLALGYDISLWHLWAEAGLLYNFGGFWLGLIPLALYLFPVFAWLMLASMYAKKAPFLWAVLPVGALLLVEAFIIEYFHLNQGFLTEMLHNYFNLAKDIPAEKVWYPLLYKIEPLAILFGAGLVYLTYWLRVNRSHP